MIPPLVEHVCQKCGEWKPCAELVTAVNREPNPADSRAEYTCFCPDCLRAHPEILEVMNSYRAENGLEPLDPEIVESYLAQVAP